MIPKGLIISKNNNNNKKNPNKQKVCFDINFEINNLHFIQGNPSVIKKKKKKTLKKYN
tara:strand:- start:222 stop:395 length:174 start_codon:yes stop_codon:yes gene_type:complete